MKRIYSTFFVAVVGLALCALPLTAQQARITVNTQNVVNSVSPWLAGSCIEDVNHEIYGGLYDQKIFGESFEEPPSIPSFENWDAFGGDWKLADQVVSVGSDAGAKLVSQTPAFSDGTVETELKFPDGTGENAGLLVRVSGAGTGADAFNGYEISLEPRTKKVILGKHLHDWHPLQSAPSSFEPQQWTRLRVALSGARIRVFVGGNPVPAIDFTDTNAPLLAGTFALRTWNSSAAFQNVRGSTNGKTAERFATKPVLQVSGQWDDIKSLGASAQFLHDRVNPYNGSRSQMIGHGAGRGFVGVSNRGLNRWGIAVKRQQSLVGRLYLRAHELQGPVTIALQSADGTRTYATQKIAKVGEKWAKYTLSLVPTADDANARFVVMLNEPGTLWIDQVVLGGTGAAQFKGLPIRADIAKAMQEQGIQFLRYGGTMVNAPEYRWKNMIGDPDRRLPYRGHWYPYSTNGFGIEEFLRFCEAANIEAAFAINIEESEQDAADLAEYLNGDATTTVWGRRRAQNGHPAPYKVRWIEIGNEEVLGGDNTAEYDHYIARFNALAAAIHAKDQGIQLVCSAWWRPDSPSVERVFKAVDGKAAFWDLHVWSDDARSGDTVDRDLTQMQSRFRQWNPATQMKCVIFEENGGLHNQQRALGHATALNAVRRHGDFVIVSCPANALQPQGQNDNGWDQGQIFFSPDQVWKMPPFYAAQMAALNYQPLRVQSTIEGKLDVTATRSEDGKVLVLHVVNTDSVAQKASIILEGSSAPRNVQIWTLAAGLEAVNSPDRTPVAPQQSQLSAMGSSFGYTFAPHSYTVLRAVK